MTAIHYDHDAGRAACWPGRPFHVTARRHEVSCGSCTRTLAFRNAPPDPPDLSLPAVWKRGDNRTKVRRKLAREIGPGEAHAADKLVIDAWVARLAA